MTSDIDKCKEKILELYRVGMTVWEIAKELKLEYPRLCYNFHKWNVEIKKCYHYPQIMNSIGMKRRRKTELDFLGRFKRGEISFRHAHDVASRMWGITEKACGVCGWKEAERDMHLIIPRLLKKKNAVSLCPNCHRLFHRGKLKLSYIKRKLIIVKI
jgi:hypothetical protein